MTRAVPAVQRAFDVLELFLDEAELSAPEITARLGLPRTTVHELLGTLSRRGYLTQVPGNRYRLGVAAFQLGAAYAERLDLAGEGRLVAAEVAADCGETVHVAVREGADVLYVAKADSSHPVRMVSAVGKRVPAHCTAVGKVLLAELSGTEFDALLGDGHLPAMTAGSTTDPEHLRRELTAARARGCAREHCESTESVACVAAPVRDRTGAVVAAISISAPILRWDDEIEAAHRDRVRDGARELSRRLGHPG
ncbi:IclR family transcriptional regulator [Saccharopolyspora sp. HNM0983]|uniref:Glycerol operon regulatory protein n=1 Tax=Saccharopolyspora montiporae TaxID=2781240 RepID=A0A929BF36_9PSEU|nr:IclR family transcriptional regulator [Saccharopolyspora sp. HNM0983]